jgi:hypothetical protein
VNDEAIRAERAFGLVSSLHFLLSGPLSVQPIFLGPTNTASASGFRASSAAWRPRRSSPDGH